MKTKAIVIGSGLGGLAAAHILARNGYEVTVLEQASQPGGCLQCFMRRGVKFETGMHFVGSADEGQNLRRMLNYFEMGDLALSRLDAQGYDVAMIGGRRYVFPTGRKQFIEAMAAHFPSQRGNLEKLVAIIDSIARASVLRYDSMVDDSVLQRYRLSSINAVIEEVVGDPVLRNVLVYNLPLFAGVRDITPFDTYGFITDFYNNSAFRIVGGSDMIARRLIESIGRRGGRVLTRHRVSRIIVPEESGEIYATGVECAGGERFAADVVVSAIHPASTLELVPGRAFRPAYRRRIAAIPNTVGCFAVYMKFKDGAMPYMNHNFYGYRGDTPWGCELYTPEEWPKGYLYMHFCHADGADTARSGVLLSYMQMRDVERWRGTVPGRRGKEYEAFKQEHAERLINLADTHNPGLRRSIDCYYTSSPLTYLDYTGTADGSMYGISHDASRSNETRVLHRTRIPNLLLTGQNINSHGIIGTMVGAVVTCSDIVGADTILRQISIANNEE